MPTIADKGGRWVMEMLTITDKGAVGVANANSSPSINTLEMINLY